MIPSSEVKIGSRVIYFDAGTGDRAAIGTVVRRSNTACHVRRERPYGARLFIAVPYSSIRRRAI